MRWLFLLACVTTGSSSGTRPPQPRVPSLQSPNYVHVESRVRDVVVARAWPHLVDESLAGAAGAVAIDLSERRIVDAQALRWRAILAGYPWAIGEARFATAAFDEAPADLVASAAARLGHDIGLVRARGRDGDHWVLLVGERRGTLPSIPREPALGQELSFPDLTVKAVAPDGAPVTAAGALVVDQRGEWLVQLRDDIGLVATFPLYVAGRTPQTPPFYGALGAEEAGDLDEELLLRMDGLDRWYQRAAAERDPALDAVARGRLRAFLSGQTLPPAETQLAAAGFFGGASGECRARTVVDCLDGIWWSLSGHDALAGNWGTIGLAVQTTSGGVAVAVAVADRAAPER
ncbi:MAG: hypothetical protein EXR71_04180 [Myxococcales bacterium]|nr:hypothetical protein [Myxococcales bacterium]